MGTIVSNNNTGLVLVDVEATYTRARARGAEWQDLVEERLAAIVAMTRTLRVELDTATVSRSTLGAEVEVVLVALYCALVVARVAYRSKLDGERFDPTMATIFELTSKQFRQLQPAQAVDEGRKLCKRIVDTEHRRVSPEARAEIAAPISAAVERLATLVPTFTMAVKRFEDARAAWKRHGRVAYLALTHLKKTWRGRGLSEARIHEVIPDRGRPKKRPAGQAGNPVLVSVPPTAAATATGPAPVPETHVA